MVNKRRESRKRASSDFMLNKNGWVGVAEAGIGALIIIGAILFIQTKGMHREYGLVMNNELSEVLNEIAQNESLRVDIVSLNLEDSNEIYDMENRINESIRTILNNKFREHKVKICKIEVDCKLEDEELNRGREVFSVERVISSDLTSYSPKKIKVFAWNI